MILSACPPSEPRIDRPIPVVIDSDAFNEVDDQFAIIHALLSPERIDLKALYAAPFVNTRAPTPEEGMRKSHEEMLRILELTGSARRPAVMKGSDRYMGDAGQAVRSMAVDDLVERARSSSDLLHVVAIGAPTNVASALVLAPDIRERIVVVWLGGHGLHWPHTREFNLMQDPAASRVLLESGVPLVLLPCMGVVQMLSTSVPELRSHLENSGMAGNYLLRTVADFPDRDAALPCWHKVIWDLAATAYLVNPAWCPSEIRPTPTFDAELTWQPARPNSNPMRYVWEVKRDEIFSDLFSKLKRHK